MKLSVTSGIVVVSTCSWCGVVERRDIWDDQGGCKRASCGYIRHITVRASCDGDVGGERDFKRVSS